MLLLLLSFQNTAREKELRQNIDKLTLEIEEKKKQVFYLPLNPRL